MTFPNPVAAIRTYLNARASDAGSPLLAYGGVPQPRPVRFTRLMLAGATDRSVAHRDARVVVESWAATEAQALEDAGLIHDWLCAMDEDDGHVPQGRDGWFGGPYSQPDPDSESPRYVQTVNLRQRRQ